MNENKDKKLAIFWDNASIHKSFKTQNFMLKNNIKSIMNVPYKPEYNAIEMLWGRAKKVFRDELTNKKIRGQELNLPQLVGQSLRSVPPDVLEKMGKRSLELLKV